MLRFDQILFWMDILNLNCKSPKIIWTINKISMEILEDPKRSSADLQLPLLIKHIKPRHGAQFEFEVQKFYSIVPRRAKTYKRYYSRRMHCSRPNLSKNLVILSTVINFLHYFHNILNSIFSIIRPLTTIRNWKRALDLELKK